MVCGWQGLGAIMMGVAGAILEAVVGKRLPPCCALLGSVVGDGELHPLHTTLGGPAMAFLRQNNITDIYLSEDQRLEGPHEGVTPHFARDMVQLALMLWAPDPSAPPPSFPPGPPPSSPGDGAADDEDGSGGGAGGAAAGGAAGPGSSSPRTQWPSGNQQPDEEGRQRSSKDDKEEAEAAGPSSAVSGLDLLTAALHFLPSDRPGSSHTAAQQESDEEADEVIVIEGSDDEQPEGGSKGPGGAGLPQPGGKEQDMGPGNHRSGGQGEATGEAAAHGSSEGEAGGQPKPRQQLGMSDERMREAAMGVLEKEGLTHTLMTDDSGTPITDPILRLRLIFRRLQIREVRAQG